MKPEGKKNNKKKPEKLLNLQYLNNLTLPFSWWSYLQAFLYHSFIFPRSRSFILSIIAIQSSSRFAPPLYLARDIRMKRVRCRAHTRFTGLLGNRALKTQDQMGPFFSFSSDMHNLSLFKTLGKLDLFTLLTLVLKEHFWNKASCCADWCIQVIQSCTDS